MALIYNGWSRFVRLAHPQARREAITSRPFAVTRLTQHAGQSRLRVTLPHAAGDQIKAMISAIRKGLDHIRATAPQLPKAERWRALIRYIIAQIRAAGPMPRSSPLVSNALLPAAQSG